MQTNTKTTVIASNSFPWSKEISNNNNNDTFRSIKFTRKFSENIKVKKI